MTATRRLLQGSGGVKAKFLRRRIIRSAPGTLHFQCAMAIDSYVRSAERFC